MNHRPGRVAAYVLSITLVPALWLSSASAGMPGVLPTSWTAKNPDMTATPSDSVGVSAMRLQAISFFVAGFLLSAWLVMRLWNAVRRDFPVLPSMTYPRSLGVLTLWGLAFIVVLTMISGARELMTPGAWRQQGWTYQLADSPQHETASADVARKHRLEDLMTAAWQFAALHQGRLPTADERTIDRSLWEIPDRPGLRFLAVDGRHAETTGRLYAFEPDSDGDERLVLMTNGLIGTMRSAEIRQSITESSSTPESVAKNTGGTEPGDFE